MTLKDWLAEQQLSASDFAARIGRTAESVRRYANGERIPDKETMPLIAAETANAVTANDFFGIATMLPGPADDLAALVADQSPSEAA